MSGPHVTVRLKGGLGNQLFEYAAARAIAIRNGTGLRLDALSGFSYDRLYQRRLKIDRFNINANYATPYESYMDPLGRARRSVAKFIENRRSWRKRRYLCEEPDRPINDLVDLRVCHPIYLDGLWQSEEYFRDVSAALRAELVLGEKITARAETIRDEITRKNSVSVHVRRLFVLPGANRPTPVEDDAQLDGLTRRPYYEAAIERIRTLVPNPHFFIFSDFPDWARENLRFPGPATFIDSGPSEDQDLMDLHLLSACRHHIIAASTFSWWGAWLSNAQGNAIIAPRLGWTHPRALPDSWIAL